MKNGKQGEKNNRKRYTPHTLVEKFMVKVAPYRSRLTGRGRGKAVYAYYAEKSGGSRVAGAGDALHYAGEIGAAFGCNKALAPRNVVARECSVCRKAHRAASKDSRAVNNYFCAAHAKRAAHILVENMRRAG